jgi:hypothetical protein
MTAKTYDLRNICLRIAENGGAVIDYTKYEQRDEEEKEKEPYRDSCYIGSDSESYSPDDMDKAIERLKELAKKKTITVS